MSGAPADGARPRVLAFGTYRPDLHPRVAVLVDGLRAHGLEVTEVNEPLPLDTAARVGMLQRPWRLPLLALALVRTWVRLAGRGRRAARDLRPDVVLVGYLGHFDVHLARLLFPRATLVLDQLVFAADTARDRGATGSAVLAALDRLDRAATRAADVVVVDTAESATLTAPRDAAKVVEVPVGAADRWFDAARAAAAGERSPVLSVVFFGLFTPLQGTTTLAEAVARLAPDVPVRLTLVGGGQDEAAVRRLLGDDPRVTWLPWVAPDELPALVAGHDVCLGVFGTTAKAARVVPTKVYQGAAAGCAVVTSGTAPQRRALGDAALYVPPGDPDALAATLTRLAGDPALVDHHRQAAARVAAERFGPAAVVGPLVAGLVASPAAPAGPRAARSDPAPGGTMPHRAASSAPPLPPRAALRWSVVREEVARVAPASIAEIGCGQGAAGFRLAGMTQRYVAVEPDVDSYTVAAARLAGRGEVRNDVDTGLLGDGPFDLVCAFEVLEHLQDDEGALQRWSELVAPGGHLLLSVPAGSHRMGPWDERVGHYRRYDAPGLAAQLTRAGLEPVRLRHYGWPLDYASEAVRNRLAPRGPSVEGASPEDRTSGSGRILQPRSVLARALPLATSPFTLLQRLAPGTGTGLVALASRPA